MGISKIGPREYLIKVRVIVPNPDPRKPRDDRRKRERFKGTQAEAEARFLAIRAELRGERLEKKVVTFGDLLNRYREFRGDIPRGEHSTYSTLERDLGHVLLTYLGGALEQYFQVIRRSISPTTGERRSAATLNRLRSMTSTTLRLATELGLIPRNPLTKSVWPKMKEIPRDRYLGEDEAQRLIEVLERRAPWLLPMTRFAMVVPCRKSELVRMRREDLDLFNNAIRVRNGTTKNDEGTWKPIPPEQVAYFRSIPAECPWLFYKLRAGRYCSVGDFKKAWRSVLAEAGIEDFRFHDTRHIAATNLVDAGTPERVVMAVAGWKTNMLSTYYKNQGKKNLGLVRFPGGSGTEVATSERSGARVGDFGTERAVI